jgi:hypothetical protein
MPNSEDEEMALYEAFVRDPDTRSIAPAPDGAPSVEFSFGGDWRECRIWEGYFDASLILLNEALQRAPQAHNLIFPALFNLRHAVEVAGKKLLSKKPQWSGWFAATRKQLTKNQGSSQGRNSFNNQL